MPDTFSATVASSDQRPIHIRPGTVELPMAYAPAYTAMAKAGCRLEAFGRMDQMVQILVVNVAAVEYVDREVTGLSREAITEGVVRLLGRESWKKGTP